MAIASARPHLDVLEGGMASAFASVIGRAVLRAHSVEQDVASDRRRRRCQRMHMHILGVAQRRVGGGRNSLMASISPLVSACTRASAFLYVWKYDLVDVRTAFPVIRH